MQVSIRSGGNGGDDLKLNELKEKKGIPKWNAGMYLHVYKTGKGPWGYPMKKWSEKKNLCRLGSLRALIIFRGERFLTPWLTDEGPPLTYTLTADWLGTEAGWWAQATGMNIVDDDEMMERPPVVHSSVLSRLLTEIPPAGITE